MKHFFYLAAIAAATASLMACSKTEVNCLDEVTTNEVNSIPTTKAIGAKSPILAVYVETNDVNPLNAVDYYFDDEDESNLIDIVELFASNIHKETVGGVERPTLYLNDKLTNVLENGGVNTYVKPLQDVNINVLLTVLGDWQHIGVANMTDTQAEQFATILAAVVKHYGLDGIGFDDEYADYYSTNSTSFSKIILTLHGLMSSDKLITVFDWGQTSTISSAAAACIDYAYHGYFGTYRTSSNITGMDKTRWSPVSFNLGNYNTTSTAQDYAARAKNAGYGALMCFNLRTRSDRDPMPVFQGLSNGAYNGKTVICDGGDRARTAGSVEGGFTITYDMALAWLAE